MSGTTFEIKDIVKTRHQATENYRSGYLTLALTIVAFILLILIAESFHGRTNWGLGLGLAPLLSSALSFYFIKRSRPIFTRRFEGTLSEIKQRVLDCKSIYVSTLSLMLVISLAIVLITAFLSLHLFTDSKTLAVYFITSAGSILFNVVAINSTVLPLIGKSRISIVSLSIVFWVMLIAFTLLKNDVIYFSAGYLLGCLFGYLISSISLLGLRSNIERKMFYQGIN